MKYYPLRSANKIAAIFHNRYSTWSVWSFFLTLCCIVLLLAACGGNTPSAQPAPVKVNGFGTAANHVHSLLALPGGVLLLATHYGIFRSGDSGKTWTMVASGPNQLMQDLMTFSLSASSLNQQHLYVLTFPVVSSPKGTLGLYSSSDQGRTWKLGATSAALGHMAFVAAGNDTPDEVYLYLDRQGAAGLKVSMDGGEHFNATGTLPFGSIQGLLALPGEPGQLLAYGDSGLARSTDSGAHWQVVSGINGALFEMTTPENSSSVIYASGDAGIYASQDSGKSFTLVESQSSYNGLAVSPTQPQELYGKLGSGVFRSSDGGHTWSPLPAIKKNLQSLAVNPTDASQVYLALDYPTEMYRYNQASTSWISLTPKA